jgi:hypothetical protein
MILHAIIGTLVVFTIVGFVLRRWHKHTHKLEYDRLIDLQDAPFKFRVIVEDGNEFAVFDLGGGATLWCDYSFGIKSDGVYGVNELKLSGLNSYRGGNITLAIGQSIFPIIQNMDAFEAWADTKAFEYRWTNHFKEAWDEMKKKLDNLRILETKSQEKEKKSK